MVPSSVNIQTYWSMTPMPPFIIKKNTEDLSVRLSPIIWWWDYLVCRDKTKTRKSIRICLDISMKNIEMNGEKDLPYTKGKRERDAHEIEPFRFRQVLRGQSCRTPTRVVQISGGQRIVKLSQLLTSLQWGLLCTHFHWIYRLPRLYRSIVVTISPYQHPAFAHKNVA